jgi:hypothetical protein
MLAESAAGTIGRALARLVAMCEDSPLSALAAFPRTDARSPMDARGEAALMAAEEAASMAMVEVRLAGASALAVVASTARRMMTFASALQARHLPVEYCDPLALAYASRRIDAPFVGWQATTGASVAKELSGLASALRSDGWVGISPYLGPRTRGFLAKNNAFGQATQSRNFPVTVQMLWSRRGKVPKAMKRVFEAALLQGLFGLRPGIMPELTREMFAPVQARELSGYVLSWTRRTKTRRGDARKRSVMAPQLSAASGPVLRMVMDACPASGLMFPKLKVASITALLLVLFPDVPAVFVLRAHGIRNGTDSSLQALGVPTDVIEAMCWWSREVRSSGYYASISVDVFLRATAVLHLAVLRPIGPGLLVFERMEGNVPVPSFGGAIEVMVPAAPGPPAEPFGEGCDSDDDDDFRPELKKGKELSIDRLAPVRRTKRSQQSR